MLLRRNSRIPTSVEIDDWIDETWTKHQVNLLAFACRLVLH
ncbi:MULTISPECIES: hypothetical protein [Thermoanaerobacterium]|nr:MULTISPECIES: hypothetical protein [Thermoanaerobacterium]